MKQAKPYSFDPFVVMSYHDLTQEARRLRRANRKLRRAIRRLSKRRAIALSSSSATLPRAQALAWRRTREHPANRAASRHGLPSRATGPFRD